MQNTILHGNAATSGGDIAADGVDALVRASYSDVGNALQAAGGVCEALTGNINADPLFVDPAGGDYHIQKYSPARDTAVCGNWAELLPGNWSFLRQAPHLWPCDGYSSHWRLER